MTVGAFEFLWCPPADQPEWERRWQTGLTHVAAGSEERESKRGQPLNAIRYTAQPITLEERAGLMAAMAAGLKSGKVCAPFWGRSSVLALDCSGTAVTLEDNLWGFVGVEYVFLFDQEARAWEVRQINTVVGNVLNLVGGAVARTYKAGTLVWPLIFGKLICENADAVTNHRAQPKLQVAENDPTFAKIESDCPLLTSYLGRPVALLEIENARLEAGMAQSFSYDLRELLLGFGASSFKGLANHVVNVWELTAVLDGAASIKAWNCLTSGLAGRANGFWLADVLCVFDIVSSPAGNTLRVTDSGLTEVWALDPAVYVVFRKEGSADRFAAITNVTDVGGGLEEVTLDAAVAVDATWLAYRLRYVRLVDDVEKGRFLAENRQRREIRVIELPEEYVAAETGTAPVWLYTFWLETPGGNTYWRYTSYGLNVVSGGNLFARANINHGAIKRSITPEADEVSIDMEWIAGQPSAFFAPLTLPLNLWVKIEEATAGTPDTTEALFVGIAQRGPMVGRKVSLKCASAIDALGAEAPGFTLQARCNWRVFGLGCTLVRNTYKVAVTIAVISADRMVIDLSGAGLNGNNAVGFAKWQDNYWGLGWIELGAGATYQIATILKSAAVVISGANGARIWLSAPLQAAAIVTGAATVTPGCDGLRGTCVGKYNNYVNFGGHPFIPKENPGLPDLPAADAAKK